MVEKGKKRASVTPEKFSAFKENLVMAIVTGAIVGAPTFRVLQAAVNWGTRPAEHKSQLKEIKRNETEIEKTKKSFTSLPFYKYLYSMPHIEDKMMDISAYFNDGELDIAEKELDKIYKKFKEAIANNRSLQARIQEIRKTESFKSRYGVESKRRNWWLIKGGIAGGLIGGAGFSSYAGVQSLRNRKKKRGNPEKPRSGKRG